MRRRKNNNKSAILFILVVVLLLMGIAVAQVSSSYTKTKLKEKEVEQLQEAIKQEEIIQIELYKTQESIDTKDFIEKTARIKFGLIYPDEVIIDTSLEE